MASEYSSALTTDQLKDLLAKVTPGEWSVLGGPDHRDSWVEPIQRGYEAAMDYPDAAMCALGPTLAAEVVRLREVLVNVAEQVRTVSNIMALSSEAEVFSLLDRNVHAIASQDLDDTSAV